MPAGIETIYQNSALCDDMTIMRNIFMGREITNSFGFMNHKKMEEVSTEVLTSGVEIAGIDSPNKEIGALSGGQKQAVAIARAVYFKRKIFYERRVYFVVRNSFYCRLYSFAI